MIDDNFIVDGKGLKTLPLKVEYYARSAFSIRDLPEEEWIMTQGRLQNNINWIKRFISFSTKWELVAGYEDCGYSALDCDKQSELLEAIDDACSLNKTFDIIVVTDFFQISRTKKDIDYLIRQLGANRTAVFCIDTESLITSNTDFLAATWPKCITLEDIATIDKMKSFYYENYTPDFKGGTNEN